MSSFKPQPQGNTFDDNQPSIDFNAINSQVKGGSRPARVSLIVDLGVQERDEFVEEYEPNKVKHKKALDNKTGYVTDDGKGGQQINIMQKDQPQIAVFGDLVNDVVNYGEEIGEKPYRLMVNNSFAGVVHGIGFTGSYAFDDKGNIQKDKGFTFHSTSKLTKLAKATKQLQIISGSGDDNMDVAQLLGKPFMATVDKQETEDGKVYINYKGCSEPPMIPDAEGNEVPYPIKELPMEAKVITFDNVTEEDKVLLRGNIIKCIKKAKNYQGSKMQQVLEAGKPQEVEQQPKLEKAEVPNKVESPQTEATLGDNFDDFDSEVPF